MKYVLNRADHFQVRSEGATGRPGPRHERRRLAVLLLCFLLVQQLGFHLASSTFPVASYWPATGVATALLWWSPRRRGRYAALLFLAGAGACLTHGMTVGEAIGFPLAHVVTAWIAAGLLGGLLGHDPTLAAGSRWVMTGLFPAVIVGALAGGVLATIAMVAIGGTAASAQFAWTWFAADTYGALSTVPALEAARHLLRRQRHRPRRPALRDPEVASRVPALVLFAVNLLVLLAASRGAGGFAGIDDSAERMLTVQLIGAGALLASLVASDLGASRYAALDAARSRLTALEDSIEGIALIGTDGLIQQANTAFADLVGGDREELTGRPWAELLDPGDPAAVHLGGLDLSRSRPASERITRDVVRLAGGTSPRVEVVLVPEHGPDGVPTAVHCFLHDVTEREKATDWVDRVFRLSPELLCVLDEHNRFVRLNPAWTHTFGYPVPALLGRRLTDLVHPDDLTGAVEQLSQVRQLGEPVAFQTRYLAADGTFRWVHWNSAADVDGALVYVVAHDVTATKMTEQALSHARDQAIEASQMKSRFLATMSHEIRTPMHGVIGLSELLDGTELDDEQRGYVQGIRKAGGALLSVINDILDFSKIEAGRMTLEENDFAPAELIDQVTAMLEQAALAKGLELVADIDPGLPTVLRGDAARIRQILVNLVGNAVKFTDSGSVIVRVDVMEHAEADLPGLVRAAGNGEPAPVPIRLEVSDSGIGMDAAAVSQLFQPFAQADVSTTRVYGGTGLGLAISRELVEAMGGWIAVQSTPGEGTTFRIALALKLPLAGSQAGLDGAGAAEQPDPSVPGACVLVVEDNDINRTVASGLLRRLGYRVDLAEDGRQALDLVAGNDYQAVLMDCQMPRMDGYTASRLLRERPGSATLPIIAMTANATSEDRQRCLEAGMNDYLSKPMGADTLDRVLRLWLAGRAVDDVASQHVPESDVPRPLAPEPLAPERLAPERLAPKPGVPQPRGAADAERREQIRSRLDELCGGRSEEEVELARAIAQSFRVRSRDILRSLRAAVEAGDGELAELHAHSLKGASANLGAGRLALMCQDAETLSVGDVADVVPGLDQLADELEATREVLRAYVEQQLLPVSSSPRTPG